VIVMWRGVAWRGTDDGGPDRWTRRWWRRVPALDWKFQWSHAYLIGSFVVNRSWPAVHASGGRQPARQAFRMIWAHLFRWAFVPYWTGREVALPAAA